MKKTSVIVTLALAAFCVSGCDFLDDFFAEPEQGEKEKEKEPVAATSISLAASGTTLNVGDDPYKIEYTVLPEGAKQDVTFVTSNAQVATVSGAGYVTAVAHGSASITISCVGNTAISATFSVYVADSGEQVVNYYVYFDGNGGQGTMNRQQTTGPVYSTPACGFTNSGYSFDGWALNSASGQKYSAGSQITAITADITLYATWKAIDPNDYYATIDDSLTGTNLLNALNTLNSQKRKRTVGYAGIRQFAAKCDANPDNLNVICGFYDNAAIGPAWDSGKTWNREHVWPQSRGGTSVEADAHMPRPASTKINNDRGSMGYGTASYDPGEYVAFYRGVASRIIFYCMIANTNLKLSEDPFDHDWPGNGDPANTMGCLSDMLRWNLQYLPSSTTFTGGDDLARRTELRRNDVIEKDSDGQGNRNPFIDHPEYACKIWGSTNASTKSICGIQ